MRFCCVCFCLCLCVSVCVSVWRYVDIVELTKQFLVNIMRNNIACVCVVIANVRANIWEWNRHRCFIFLPMVGTCICMCTSCVLYLCSTPFVYVSVQKNNKNNQWTSWGILRLLLLLLLLLLLIAANLYVMCLTYYLCTRLYVCMLLYIFVLYCCCCCCRSWYCCCCCCCYFSLYSVWQPWYDECHYITISNTFYTCRNCV